jgi:hypothetical protein
METKPPIIIGNEKPKKKLLQVSAAPFVSMLVIKQAIPKKIKTIALVK